MGVTTAQLKQAQLPHSEHSRTPHWGWAQPLRPTDDILKMGQSMEVIYSSSDHGYDCEDEKTCQAQIADPWSDEYEELEYFQIHS